MFGHYCQVSVDEPRILMHLLKLQNVRRGMANNIMYIIHTHQCGMAETKS